MTATGIAERAASNPIEELLDFLEENWDPDLRVAEWWERLGLAGWAAPMLPHDRYGRDLNRGDTMRVQRAIAAFGALGPPVGLGLMLAAPTIATHGTDQQVDRYVRDIVTGKKAWCQLFSEPGAGSDLASLTTRATKDGDRWIVTGQKVWTSAGQLADLGMLLARTNPEVPKHQGIKWFALDMHQPGVEVRPLREMTGNALFSEVFLSDAEVGDEARIGDTDRGWSVANTTLLWERTGMGAGGGAPPPLAQIAYPGTVAGNLERRAGDFVAASSQPSPEPGEKPRDSARGVVPSGSEPSPEPGEKPRASSPALPYIELARRFGRDQDPVVRQALARLHTLRQLSRLNTERNKAAQATGRDVPGIANFSKLMMADVVRLTRDLGLEILGPRGTLHPYDGDARAALIGEAGGATAVEATSQALSAQALPIYGGTDQIQRNIIGERVLGLPKEPGNLSNVPFNQLPTNG